MSRSSAFDQTDGASLGPAQLAPAGAIQPHGLLQVVRTPLLRIVQASGNAGPLLQRPLHTLLLATLRDLGGDLESRVRELLAAGACMKHSRWAARWAMVATPWRLKALRTAWPPTLWCWNSNPCPRPSTRQPRTPMRPRCCGV